MEQIKHHKKNRLILLTITIVCLLNIPLTTALSITEYIDDFPQRGDILLDDIENISLPDYHINLDMYLGYLSEMPYTGKWYILDTPHKGIITLSFFYKDVPDDYPSQVLLVYINTSSGNAVYGEYYTYEYRKTVTPESTDIEIARYRMYEIPEGLQTRSIYKLPLKSDYYPILESYGVFIFTISVIAISIMVFMLKSKGLFSR